MTSTRRQLGFDTQHDPAYAPPKDMPAGNEEAPQDNTISGSHSDNVFLSGKPNPDPRLGAFLAMVFEGQFNIDVNPQQLSILSPNGNIYFGIGTPGPDLHVVYQGPFAGEGPIMLYEGCQGPELVQKFVRAVAPNTIVGMMQQREEQMEE